MTATQKSVQTAQRSYTARRSLTSILTIIVAALAALAVWAIAVPVVGIVLVVPQAGVTVGPVSISVAVLVAGLAAWGLRAIVARTSKGRNVWTTVGIVVLVLSLGGPALSGAVGSVLIILEIMHVVVGVVLIVGLRRAVSFGPVRHTDA